MKNILAQILSSLLALQLAFAAPGVALSWQDNSNNEDGFKVERATGTNNFIQIAVVEVNVVAYTDSAVASSTTYRYRVRSFNTAGDSVYSNIATVTTPATQTIPNAPGGINAIIPGKLVNISARSQLVDSNNPLIGGFVVQDGPTQVLIRGIGPTLAQFGITDVLADPTLQLIGGAANDNWSGAEVAAAAAQEFAFALPVGSKDAAMLVTLPPGIYTVHLTGVGATSGVALLEIYEVLPQL